MPAEPAAAPSRGGASDLDVTAVREAWSEIVALVNQSNKRIAALMRDAVVHDLADDTLVVTVRSAVLAQMLSAQLDLIAEAVHEVLGVRWQIRCEVAGDQRQAGTRRSGGTTAAPSRSVGATRRSGGTAAVPASRAAGDWPEPARPGGSAVSSGGGDDWPTPASPGGGGGQPEGGTSTLTAGRAPVPAEPAAADGTRRRPASAATGSGVDRGNRDRRARVAVADPEWAGEPPYDPDYDGPVGYEGFDPGDEPLDEVVDEQTVRQTSEQQAVRLLQQKLGAEKIGEVDLA